MNGLMKERDKAAVCLLCGSTKWRLLAELRVKPRWETDFGIPADSYYREILRCEICGVCISQHDMLPTDVYSQQYNKATYHNDLEKQFLRIMNLPEEKSDNKQRVARVLAFVNDHMGKQDRLKVLDVGSGLCVFLAEMKKHEFYCECLDPDPRATEHALANANVDKAVTCSFDGYQTDIVFDLITFNKVLEHVTNPVHMLNHARAFLGRKGVVYVELPDSEGALVNGSINEREEFYVEHHVIFDIRSTERLAASAGYSVLSIKQMHEPSDKYTVSAFLE